MRKVMVYQDENGDWIAEVPSLPGCGIEGKTRAEALQNVQDAIQLWREVTSTCVVTIPMQKWSFPTTNNLQSGHYVALFVMRV